jgi:hypothetical protein
VLKALALLDTVDDSVDFAAQLAPRAESVLVVPRGIRSSNRPGQASTIMEAP